MHNLSWTLPLIGYDTRCVSNCCVVWCRTVLPNWTELRTRYFTAFHLTQDYYYERLRGLRQLVKTITGRISGWVVEIVALYNPVCLHHSQISAKKWWPSAWTQEHFDSEFTTWRRAIGSSSGQTWPNLNHAIFYAKTIGYTPTKTGNSYRNGRSLRGGSWRELFLSMPESTSLA